MAWILLIIAGVLEVVWAYAMKQSEGFTRVVPTAITLTVLPLSLGLLSYAMRTLPLGTAYASWTGIGAVGAFGFGIFALGEQPTPGRIVGALLVVAGVAMMKFTSAS